MPANSLERLLDRLDESKRPAGAGGRARLRDALRQTARRRFRDAASLIRFHEILLFMRAHPQGAPLLRETEKLLKTFSGRVARLREDGADTFPFERLEVSGIAGTGFDAIFGYDIVRWLARAHPRRVRLVWDDEDDRAHLHSVFSHFMPLFEEEVYVDTHTPFRRWLSAATPRGESELHWLIRRFESLPVSEKIRAELFDPLKLWVRWELKDSRATRTHARLPTRATFYHRAPLLERRDVKLARELDAPPLPIKKLSRADAERVLAFGRDAMCVRFRELHGFTHGDARTVLRADAGRGLRIFVWGALPARRLPLLAYHCGMFVKNGVAVGYHEGLSLFGRTEIGVNLFYTFRDGESAWTYARLMRLYKQLLGTRTFSVEPYQLGGSGNDEGIESGAFWFYRKLGFRPVLREVARLVEAEEQRIASRRGYRTSPPKLRRLAAGHVLYETPDAARAGEWDRFRTRNIGLAVQRRMAREFGGDARKVRDASVAEVVRALGATREKFDEDERRALSNLALPLALIPDLARWTVEEKRAVAAIVRAKAGRDELNYLRLLRRHARLRRAIIALGTS
ncbi:MAG: hypothetical protein LC785_08585 [Acidobacteria bacterium]|nr:hypothetical protein [Acidobacteriota bacterium]